jgi:hypothetical protein
MTSTVVICILILNIERLYFEWKLFGGNLESSIKPLKSFSVAIHAFNQ